MARPGWGGFESLNEPHAMKRIAHSSTQAMQRSAAMVPSTPFEFLLRIRSHRRVVRVPAGMDGTLVAAATRSMLRCR